MTAYEWIQNRYAIDANVVGRAVEEIEERDGVCHPSLLVDIARPSSSPLHPLFEWDDGAAAERYREYQARKVINSLTIVGSPVEDSPAWVSLRLETEAGPRRGYVATSRGREDKAIMNAMLKEARRSLDALRVRYRRLEQLKKIWEAVDDTFGKSA